MIVLRSISVAAVLSLLIACGGGHESGTTGTPSGNDTPVAVQIVDGSSLLIVSGTSRMLTAVATNKNQLQIAGATFTWTSSDQSIVTVNGPTVTGVKAGTATVTAASGSVSASIAVTVSPGAVSQLVLRTQPSGAVVGAALATQPVVEFRDAAGNLVTSSAPFVSAAIGTGGGTLSGSTTIQASGGVAAFTDLKINGTSGPRTLTFTAGVLTTTSSSFNVDPPPAPFIVADSTAVSFALQGIGDSATRTLNIVNGGSQTLSGMSVSILYDAGPALGWLTAQLTKTDAPSVLTLVAHGGALAGGTYHAIVEITGPGASNSPLSIGVTLTIDPRYTLSFGNASEKVRVLDVGGTFTPSVAVVDASGAPVKTVPATFISRASTVATVSSSGVITAVSGGDAWIVANAPASSDSVFVVVPRSPSAPRLITDVTNSTVKLGDTLFVTVVFDARSVSVGAASLAVELLQNSGSYNYFYSVPASTPAPVVNGSTNALIRISLGAATGFTGAVQVLKLELVGRSANTTGWVNLFVLGVSAVDGTDLTAQTSSTRIPLIIR